MGDPARCLCGRLPGRACTSKGCQTALTDAFDRMAGALRKIAVYDDEGASATLERTGSYGSFDCAGAVQIARETLEELGVQADSN